MIRRSGCDGKSPAARPQTRSMPGSAPIAPAVAWHSFPCARLVLVDDLIRPRAKRRCRLLAHAARSKRGCSVTAGLDPGGHHSSKKIFCEADGLHRNSGLPELRTVMRRKSGKPDLRVKPGNDAFGDKPGNDACGCSV